MVRMAARSRRACSTCLTSSPANANAVSRSGGSRANNQQRRRSVFSTAEVEARAPLINHLKDYFPGIDGNTPTRELIHKARLTGASDPLLARAIRRCEDVEQNSRTEQS